MSGTKSIKRKRSRSLPAAPSTLTLILDLADVEKERARWELSIDARARRLIVGRFLNWSGEKVLQKERADNHSKLLGK